MNTPPAKQALSKIAKAMVAGGAAALIVFFGAPMAVAQNAAVNTPSPQAETPMQVQTNVSDPDGRLSDGDKQMLSTETARLELPLQVQQVEYIVLGKNDDNFNDSIEKFIRASRPELIADDNDSFSNGTLIVAVGMNPHRNGIYCGDDVCSELSLWSGKHLDRSLAAMKAPLKHGNTAAGLLEGAKYAVDKSHVMQDSAAQTRDDTAAQYIGGGVAGAAVLGIGGTVIGVRRRARKKKIAEARADFDYVMRTYADVAQRLPAIDVRANSLRSELADAELRRQWADVRDRFAELDETVDKFRNVHRDSDDNTFFEHAAAIDLAETTTLQVTRAEENIEKLWQMENGNVAQRRTELNNLREDVIKAHSEVSSQKLTARLETLEGRIDQLNQQLEAPDFATQYAQILRDYRMLLDLVQKEEFSDVPVSEAHQAPRLYDEDYRIGYGYNNYVPFWLMSSWHQSDIDAQQAAASSANTTFSSGFSGGGGSSSW